MRQRPLGAVCPLTIGLLGALLSAWGCQGSDITPTAASNALGPIEVMQVLFNGQMVSIDFIGRVTGGPPLVGGNPYGFDDDFTAVEVRFAGARGYPVGGVQGHHLLVTSADTSMLKFVPVDALTGQLVGRGRGATWLTFQLIRNTDQRVVFGPVDLDVQVGW